MRTHVTFACVNEIEAMYERPRVNVKVERGSTFTLRVDRSYIASKPALTASILFTRVHTEKLRDSGNPP